MAQTPVRLTQETQFLKEPGGVELGTLNPGIRLAPGRSAEGHLEITLHGWIFTSSTRADGRDGFDLSVATPENLRASPDGAILARLVTGTLLSRVSTRGGWTEVRRTGWIPRPPAPAARAAGPAAASEEPRSAPPASPPPPPGPPSSQETRAQLKAGAALSRAPDGPALGNLAGPADVSIEERKGDWVRVRVDAWVKRSDIEGALAPPPAITAAMLRESPERYVGQTVEWRVQFLAHQQADELRPEMPNGHPYLLVRGPLPESGFAYVMVSKEQAVQLRGLQPLDELTLTVTVRAARTRYLATPVVELVRLGPAQ